MTTAASSSAACPAGRYLLSVKRVAVRRCGVRRHAAGTPRHCHRAPRRRTAHGHRAEDDSRRRASPAPSLTNRVSLPSTSTWNSVRRARAASDQQMLRNMMRTPRTRTDDRGTFRFSGLAAGEYILAVTPADLGGSSARVLEPGEVKAAMDSLRQPPAPQATPSSEARLPNTTVILPPRRGGPRQLRTDGARPAAGSRRRARRVRPARHAADHRLCADLLPGHDRCGGSDADRGRRRRRTARRRSRRAAGADDARRWRRHRTGWRAGHRRDGVGAAGRTGERLARQSLRHVGPAWAAAVRRGGSS